MKNPIILIPTLNEARHILRVISAIRADNPDIPIWVIDGGSTDGTCSIITRANFADVRILANPNRTQAHAINLGARLAWKAGYDCFVRMDAHAIYPANFVGHVLSAMNCTGAKQVVVPRFAVAPNSSVTQAMNSWIGHGGAPHRHRTLNGWVRHGHHAGFDMNTFLGLGGYDTAFSACEDVDFDERMRRAGCSIWCQANVPVGQYVRDHWLGTLHQYIRNGAARMRFWIKWRSIPEARQGIPVAVTISMLLAIFGPVFPVFYLPALGYLITLIGIAVRFGGGAAVRAACMHLGFGIGVLTMPILRGR